MQYTAEQKQEKYKTLPQPVKDALLSMETAQAIYDIVTKHKLGVKEAGIVADETGNVMLGLTRASDYVKQLETRLEADKEVVVKIAEEINSTVFVKVREHIKGAGEVSQKPAKSPEASPSNLPGTTSEPDYIQKIKNAEFDPSASSGQAPSTGATSSTSSVRVNSPRVGTAQDNVSSEIERELGLNAGGAKASAKHVAAKTEPSVQKKEAVPEPQLNTKPNDGIDPYREPIDSKDATL